jgi:hypothetical protein
MAGISLILQNNPTVTSINCGTSSPKLSGTIDISAFPNLQQFRCNSNDITAISGYENNANIRELYYRNNKVSGSLPSLSGMTNLQYFFCDRNLHTGNLPSSFGPNIRDFRCWLNSFSGPIPNILDGQYPRMETFLCDRNQLTGPIPVLSGTLIATFHCFSNLLTGPIPTFNGRNLIRLREFHCDNNRLSGPIPTFDDIPALRSFRCNNQNATVKITGSIPSLSANTALEEFRCNNNQLTGFDGGSVSNTLGDFQAQNNQLTQSAVDSILSAFDATTRTATPRTLSLGGTTNSAPSYTGGVTTTSPGSNFSRSGTLVTANVTGHGHTTGDLVTITAISPTAFQGTFSVTVTGPNQFQYTTVTSGAATGSGTATMRRTTNANDGFRSYQNLALVTRLGGFPWNVTINFP